MPGSVHPSGRSPPTWESWILEHNTQGNHYSYSLLPLQPAQRMPLGETWETRSFTVFHRPTMKDTMFQRHSRPFPTPQSSEPPRPCHTQTHTNSLSHTSSEIC